MIPHRSFTTYIDYDSIENNLQVPIFGNRGMLRTEERNVEKNQYYLLEKANIRYPKLFNKPEDIDRLVIVKVMESTRKIERAFFTASSFKEFNEKAEKRIAQGIINAEDLADARIEEFILGTYFNFNFFYSILHDRVSLHYLLNNNWRLMSNYRILKSDICLPQFVNHFLKKFLKWVINLSTLLKKNLIQV